MHLARQHVSRPQVGYALLAGYLLVYLSWQAFAWLPVEQSLAGDLLGLPLNLAAVCASWAAARRASASKRVSRAWVWVTLALAGQAAGAIAQLFYEATTTEPSYPSVSDPFYLSFYPLLLIGVLTFPVVRRGGRHAFELALDCAIVALGGGAAFVYFVLGPEALAGSTLLEAAVTIAYPVGDMILLVALAAALMRTSMPATRLSLRWISAAMSLFVIGDFAFGYAVLHGGYEGGDLLDTFYELAFACFILAAAKQHAVTRSETTRRASGADVSWLPFAGVAAALAILLAEEYDNAFFPGLAITLIAAVVTVLVVARQLLLLAGARQASSRLAEAQRLAHIGSWDWDIEHDQVEFSDELARIFGIDSSRFLSLEQSLRMIHSGDRETVRRLLEESIAAGQPFVSEMRIVRPDGEVRTVLARGEVVKHGDRVLRMFGTNQDITDRREMETQLRYQADHDPLTGLFNRRRFSQELERSLRSAAHYDRSGAVLMLDIDNFKFVNDSKGHTAGDEMLKAVAEAIVARAGDTDAVARLGADEFAVVLPEAEEEKALQVAESMRRAVSGNEEVLQLSVGVALFGASSEMVAEDVLIAADVALYEAKEAGKDQVRVYRGEANTALTWVERIREALAVGRFVLYAQPILDLRSGRVDRQELLIRMLSDDGDVIAPDSFLPTAERFGLMGAIDRWVVGEALKLARQGERLAINLSASSIGSPEILRMVREALAGPVAPQALLFEITETAAMTNMEDARAFAGALNDLGCGVALDDFGTGFASFTYLKHLPTRYLKIDKEFVREMLVNPTDREVVKSITGVAHSLGKETIAEGVEDEATLEALRGYGVDMAQGFFVGRPQRISPSVSFERNGGLGFGNDRAVARDRVVRR